MDKLIKKKKEEDEQQRLQEALDEFRETFDDTPGKHVPKTFIRGDIVNANKSIGNVPAVYKPVPVQNKPLQSTMPPQSLEKARKIAEETARKIMQEASKQKSSNIPPNRPPKPGSAAAKKSTQSAKLTNLEIFKEELKQVQALRQERKGLRQQLQEQLGVDNIEAIDRIAPPLDNPYLNTGISEYEDDPSTTNLYVCNMPMDIQMEDLYETFGSFGPLASAKILYPRNDEERRRDHLCGFIAFISRTDAERAWCAMSGEKLRDCELRVSWARPVPIPPVPFFVPIPLRELAMPDPPSGLPFNAKPITSDLRDFIQKYGDLPRLNAPLPMDHPQLVEDYKKMISNSVVRVVVVSDKPLLMLIHRVVEYLVREGPLFEALIMGRERNNPMYRFLFENAHPTHVYYRWKLYSILQGEDRTKWRLERFRMFEDGSWWEPPPHSLFENGMPPQLYNTAYVPKRRGAVRYEARLSSHRKRSRNSSGSDEERPEKSEHKKSKYKGILGNRDREELEEFLRNLIPEKNSIGDAMMWCVEHADCAKEIVQCIYESLCIKETPLHKKIARMYLISDILANCGARLRDVFYFRQYFGDVLQKVFAVLNETLEGIQSRIKVEQFRSRVMLCFRMWEDNSLYPTDALITMQNIFLGLTKPMASTGSDYGDDDLDGEPLLEDDIDGVPLMEDERERTHTSKKVPLEDNSMFKTTSWSQVDVASEPAVSVSKWDAIETKWDTPAGQESTSSFTMAPIKHDVDHGRRREKDVEVVNLLDSPNGHLKAHDDQAPEGSGFSKEHEEERRKMLRDIEVKVMKLQDELEMEHCKNIDEEIGRYREKLTIQMEDKLKKVAEKSYSSSSKDKERHKKDKSSEKSRKRSRERSDPRSEHSTHRNDSSSHHRSADESRDNSRERRSHRDEDHERGTRSSRGDDKGDRRRLDSERERESKHDRR